MVLYNIILHLIYYLFILSGDSSYWSDSSIYFISFVILSFRFKYVSYILYLLSLDMIVFHSLQIDISVVYFLLVVHICSLLVDMVFCFVIYLNAGFCFNLAFSLASAVNLISLILCLDKLYDSAISSMVNLCSLIQKNILL
jgi:hypothetical protein